MRLLITGASGFIGRSFLGALAGHEIVGLCRSRVRPDLVPVDLTDAAAAAAAFAEHRPEAAIHCAARPSVDWCEANPAEAHRLNVGMTRSVLAAAAGVGAAVVFLSTDYVFDGEAGPYGEDDAVAPINVYGRLKLECERVVLAADERNLVVRTTNVYGYDAESKNFLMAILPDLAAGKKVRVAADQFGTPTLVEDLCRVVAELLSAHAAGVVHVAGPEVMNRVEWAAAAAAQFGLDAALIEGASTEELGQQAPRPRRAGLTTRRLAQLVGARPRALAEGLAHMRAQKAAAFVHAW